MRLGRWLITIGRAPRPSAPFTSEPLPLEDFARFPDDSIVRNTRTGENIWVRPPQRPATIIRGVGCVGPMPTLPDDKWILIATPTYTPGIILQEMQQ